MLQICWAQTSDEGAHNIARAPLGPPAIGLVHQGIVVMRESPWKRSNSELM